MKKAVILIASMLLTTSLMAQQDMNSIEEGTVVTLGPVSAAGYQHIDFPRKNIIIKRGAIANFHSLSGEKLIVKSLEKDKNGADIAILKRKNGLNFFRFFPEVKADLSMALESGELKMTGYSGTNSIAQQ